MTNKVEVDKGLIEVLRLKARVLDISDDRLEVIELVKKRDEFLTKIAGVIFTGSDSVTYDQILDEVIRLKNFENDTLYKVNLEEEKRNDYRISDRDIEEAEFSEYDEEADEDYVNQ